jgi:hypothetical protein
MFSIMERKKLFPRYLYTTKTKQTKSFLGKKVENGWDSGACLWQRLGES